MYLKKIVLEWDRNFWIFIETRARFRVNVIRVDPNRADSIRLDTIGAESTRFNPIRSFFIPNSIKQSDLYVFSIELNFFYLLTTFKYRNNNFDKLKLHMK